MSTEIPATDGTARYGVVTLVGNPRPASRTRTAGETAARRVAQHLGLTDERTTVDLADLATEVLAPVHPRVDVALRVLPDADDDRRPIVTHPSARLRRRS